MGWTWYHARNWKNGQIDRKAECRDFIFGTGTSDWAKNHRLVKDALVGSTYYAAIENALDGEVWACVCLTQTEGERFGIKDMDERMGPVQCTCPESILNLLTPTDSEYAREWRRKCRENAERRKGFASLSAGQKARWTAEWTAEPHFAEGDTLILEKRKLHPQSKNSKFIWLIAGTNCYVRPADVDITTLVLLDEAV